VDAAGRAAMVVFVATIKGDVDADT